MIRQEAGKQNTDLDNNERSLLCANTPHELAVRFQCQTERG